MIHSSDVQEQARHGAAPDLAGRGAALDLAGRGAAPDLDNLRAQVRRLERGGAAPRPAVPLGLAALDERLPGGGLPLAGLHEIEGERAEWDDGVASGFALALLARLLAARDHQIPEGPMLPDVPVLWAAPRRDLYGPGLADWGLDPGRLILAHAGGDREVLWALEEGLRAGALAAVVGEVGELDRLAGRRLQLAAEAAGRPCFLLHRRFLARRPRREPSAALTRWRVAPLSPPGGPAIAFTQLDALVRSHRCSRQTLPVTPDKPCNGASGPPSTVTPDKAHRAADPGPMSKTDSCFAMDPGSTPLPGSSGMTSGSGSAEKRESDREDQGGGATGLAAQLPGRARWQVELLRCRGAAPASFALEWDGATGGFALAAALRDGPPASRPDRAALAAGPGPLRLAG